MAAKLKVVDGRPTAKALLAEAARRFKEGMLPCDEALAELDILFAENGKLKKFERVTADAAMSLLHAYGWTGGRQKFDRIVKTRYGKGWGQ